VTTSAQKLTVRVEFCGANISTRCKAHVIINSAVLGVLSWSFVCQCRCWVL